MMLQILVLLPTIIVVDRSLVLPLSLVVDRCPRTGEQSAHDVCHLRRCLAMFGDVVVVREGGEVLRVEYRVAVSVLFPHRFVASETSPVIKSVSSVDDQFTPEMSIG